MDIYTHMGEAINLAKYAATKDLVPVAALIVNYRTNQVIASSYNSKNNNHSNIAHAEILAIEEASEKLKTGFLTDCDIYVTLEPCSMCIHAISLARIRRLYFAAYDSKNGAVEYSRSNELYKCSKTIEWYGGVMEQESAAILKQFFLSLR